MLGDDQRLPGGLQLGNEVAKIVDSLGREIRGRLVEEEQIDVSDQGTGTRDALQLPSREGVEPPVKQVCDAGLADCPSHGVADLGRVDPVVLQPESQLGSHDGGEELGARILKDHRRGAPDVVEFNPGQISAVHLHSATHGALEKLRDEAIHRPQQGGLP